MTTQNDHQAIAELTARVEAIEARLLALEQFLEQLPAALARLADEPMS